MFADDTSIQYEADSHADLQTMMQNDLDASDGVTSTLPILKLNPENTQYMTFSSQRIPSPNVDISVGGIKIEETITAKYLGCLIDDRLEAVHHVKELCNGLNRNIFLTRTLCKLTGFRLSKLLYIQCLYQFAFAGQQLSHDEIMSAILSP